MAADLILSTGITVTGMLGTQWIASRGKKEDNKRTDMEALRQRTEPILVATTDAIGVFATQARHRLLPIQAPAGCDHALLETADKVFRLLNTHEGLGKVREAYLKAHLRFLELACAGPDEKEVQRCYSDTLDALDVLEREILDMRVCLGDVSMQPQGIEIIPLSIAAMRRRRRVMRMREVQRILEAKIVLLSSPPPGSTLLP